MFYLLSEMLVQQNPAFVYVVAQEVQYWGIIYDVLAKGLLFRPLVDAVEIMLRMSVSK